ANKPLLALMGIDTTLSAELLAAMAILTRQYLLVVAGGQKHGTCSQILTISILSLEMRAKHVGMFMAHPIEYKIRKKSWY
ncbi:hypothetical protein, partial [Bartonella sp. AP23HLJMH]|uniref:hypothetical protein n=1 Tax=Bartonella sp. AP23HLJMH TaxID=3243478 RepID=UPI0035CFF2CA